MFLPLLLYLLTSFSFILFKESLFFASPFFLVGLRLFIAGGLLLIYYKGFRQQKIHIKRKDFWLFGIVAFLGSFVTNSCDLWALQYLYAAKVALIYMLAPFFGTLISYILFKEYLSKTKLVGLGIGFSGLLILLWSRMGGAPKISLADLAVILAAFSTVAGWFAMKELVDKRAYPPIMVNAVCLSLGGVFAFILSLSVESWHPLPVTNVLYCLVFVITSALIAHIICYNLYAYLLKKYSVVFMTFASFTSPLFTAILSYLFLGEKVPRTFYISLIMIFIGLYFFYKDEFKRGKE